MFYSQQETTQSSCADHLPALFRDNAYALTGLFLAPGKDRRTLARLRTAMQTEAVDWGRVLHQANLHFCTPMLYSRLRQDALLSEAPVELQQYLHCLHMANRERNDAFRLALREILQMARDLAIPCLLLKGAGSFCDKLYDDPAARMLGDLDILVEPMSARQLWHALIERAGFIVDPTAQTLDYSLFAPDYLPHHLPRLYKSGTPVAVEIHFRPGRGLAGRGMPSALFWENRTITEWEGLPVFFPDPQWRLLHVSLHALVPKREFILSNISLAALTEFNALRHRYPTLSSLAWWQRQGEELGLGHEFRAFAHLAQLMTAGQHPPGASRRTRFDTARILAGGVCQKGVCAIGMVARLRIAVARLWIRGFYLRHRFGWIWRNACHAPGWRQIPRRLNFMKNWLFVLTCKQIKIPFRG